MANGMGSTKRLIPENYRLAAIFIIALAVRLVYVLTLSTSEISPDGGDWIHIATGILNGLGYGDNWRAPVYSYFLSGIFFFKAGSILLVRVMQSVLSSLTCVVLYYIAKKVFDRRVGLLAALISAFYPYFIYNAGDVLRETLFTFLISLSILVFIMDAEQGSIPLKIYTGILFGLSVLCKSTVLPFYLLAFVWYVISRPAQTNTVNRLKGALVVFAAMALTIAPWTVRNYFHYHHFVLVETRGPEHLWQANNKVSLKFEDIPHLDVSRLPDQYAVWCDTTELEAIMKLPRFEGEKVFMKQTVDFIRNNPSDYAVLLRKRMFNYWRLYPRVATRRNKIAAALTSGWIIPLGWLGVLLSWKGRWRKTSLFALLFFCFTFVHMVFWAMVRFRVPIDPYVIMFCSFTVFYAVDAAKTFKGHGKPETA